MIKPGDEPIPGYRVEELLGRGQFGQVWRARSPGNTYVALKFLDLDGRYGWKEFRSVQRVKQIRHAHLMPIVAIWLLDENGQVLSDDAIDGIAADFQDAKNVDVTSETLVAVPIEKSSGPIRLVVANLLADCTLGDRLEECRASGGDGIPIDELLGYMREAAKGLDFLNSSQHLVGTSLGSVQHCDVKPDNIMLSGGSVVISDFGVAQLLAESRRDAKATSLGGTPAFMAPELFRSKPSSTTDQYALAVTYYELRTGKLPFIEHTFAAIQEAHQTGKLEMSDVETAERRVIAKATSTDPAHRYNSCTEFVDALHNALFETEAPRKANRLLAIGILGLALSVGAASFYAWRYGGVELNGDEQQSDPTPTPPLATIEVPVVVDPPQARVAINGVVLAIENGRGAYQAMPDELLKIEADYGSDWRPFEKIYSTADLEGTVNIALQRTAESWESLAYERLGDNQFAEAVDALANAIKGDKSFAAVPKPDYEKRLPGEIQSLRANRDGSEIVAGTSEGVVQRWKLDGDDVKLAARIELADADIESLVVSDSWMTVIGGDRRRVLLSSADETVEWGISNMPEGTQVKEIAIVDGGKRLVAATELFEFLPGESDKRNVTLISWALHRPTATDAYATHLSLDGDSEPVLAAARRGAWVVLSTYSTSDKAYHVRKHLLENGGAQELHRQRAEIVAIAVSLDDQLIAIGGGKTTDNEGVADCRATLIHAGDLSSAELDIGHEDVISSIAIDAAGRHVVTAGMDGAAIVWSLRSGWRPGQVGQPLTRSLLQLPDQPFVESAVCLHSGWTACLYANGAAALWDSSAKTPTPLRLTAVQPQFLSAIATTPGGEWLITGDRSGRVRFWRTDRLRLIKNARDQAGVGEERSRTDDHVMRCGRFGRPTRRSPEAYAGTACDSGRRPTEATV